MSEDCGNDFAIAPPRMPLPHLWSVVLAAGRGSRLSSVTGGIPKQFWAPPHGQSLLEATVDRVRPLVGQRIITVVDRSHGEHLGTRCRREALGDVIYQPCDRGTAAGVLLAVMAVRAQDPDAVVLITPSDHGVADPRAFRAGIRSGVAHVHARKADVLLFGAAASRAAEDYGWILPAGGGGLPDRVASFVEKPTPKAAEALHCAGAVWNTMVMVARVRSLVDLYRAHVPGVLSAFDALLKAPPEERDDAAARVYRGLATTDFSRDVLGRAAGLRFLTFAPATGWTDLGTPDRLAAWLTSKARPERAASGVHQQAPLMRSLRSA